MAKKDNNKPNKPANTTASTDDKGGSLIGWKTLFTLVVIAVIVVGGIIVWDKFSGNDVVDEPSTPTTETPANGDKGNQPPASSRAKASPPAINILSNNHLFGSGKDTGEKKEIKDIPFRVTSRGWSEVLKFGDADSIDVKDLAGVIRRLNEDDDQIYFNPSNDDVAYHVIIVNGMPRRLDNVKISTLPPGTRFEFLLPQGSRDKEVYYHKNYKQAFE